MEDAEFLRFLDVPESVVTVQKGEHTDAEM